MSPGPRSSNGGLIEFVPFIPPLAVLLLPAVILAWCAPRLASMLSGAKAKPPVIKKVDGKVVDAGKNRGTVRLEFPSSIKISQTINVRAWFQPDTPPATPATAKLESGDFKIVATNTSDSALPEYKYQWDWLISAETTGERALYFWVDPSTELVLEPNESSLHFEPAKNKVLVPISVLTDLGLSATQDAWAKAIGAVAGILIAVAGLGFWKRKKDKKQKEAVVTGSGTTDQTHTVSVTTTQPPTNKPAGKPTRPRGKKR